MKSKKMLSQVIIPDDVFELQNSQYRDVVLLTGSVPALSGGTPFNQNVGNDGHFYCMYMTGSFEALANPAGAIIDTGVNYISGQLRHGSRTLFSQRIPLNLFLSPGRRRSAASTTVLADPIGESLFYPIELEHLWEVNSNITMDVANTSNVACTFEIAFHGWRIVATAAAELLRKKAAAANQ